MFTKVGRIGLLGHIVANAGLSLTHRLCKVDPAPADEDVSLADLTEADFDGYAPISGLAYPVPIVNAAGHGETLSPTATWTAGAGVVSQTLYGAFLTVTISGGPVLLWWTRFAAPIVVDFAGETVNKKFNLLDDDGGAAPF